MRKCARFGTQCKTWSTTFEPRDLIHPLSPDQPHSGKAGRNKKFRQALAPLFCARVGAVVHLRQLCGGELGVPLRGGKALVAEEFLDRPEVGALFQQVSAESVPQGVGMDIGREAPQNGGALDDPPDTARG